MSNDFDMNAIAADVTTQLVKDTWTETFSRISKAIKFAHGTIFTDFRDHLLSLHEQISTVKIITNRDQPVRFEKIYTSSGFSCNNKIYSDSQLIEVLASGKRCVLSGNGGAGKTFMMRNIWLEFFKRKGSQVPVLVELRKLNSLSTYDIISFIRAGSFGETQLDENIFKHFCEKGAFVFLLDGFDEVVKEKREELERQILSLSRSYPQCGIIVSGRPDDRFGAWSDFYTFKAEPFSYGQFKELIAKVPFDLPTKKSFQKLATETFFDKHRSFLSNPLLSLMMLLTFRDNAEIPSRLSTFYENCFSTLYAQHDALKESFNRKKSLDQLRFKRLFSAFSLVTYLASRPSLSGSEFIQAIEKAKDIADINVETDEVAHDLLESVNLLIKEGETYSYIHRSFQEFFAANCVAGVLSTKQEDIIAKFAKRTSDETLRLIYELHPKLVEDKVIIPKYNKLKSSGKLPRRSSKGQPYNCISKTGMSFDIILRPAMYRDGIKKFYLLYGFRISWDDDYEVITPAAHIAKSENQVLPSPLNDEVLNMAVFEIIRSLDPRDDAAGNSFDPSEYNLGDTISVKFTFSPEAVNAHLESNEDDDMQEAVLDRCLKVIEKKRQEIEKFIIENNKNIVDSCELIIASRDRHNIILGEVTL